jgi:anaerobic selenocysteine-containing dehydrogenase
MTIDGTAKPLISDLVGGFVGLSGRPDYDGVDFMIFVGTNPVISHGHAIAVPNPTGTVRAIAKRGQVWVIDPRRTETARLATGHLAPRPGTDHAVLAYLVRELLCEGADPGVPVQDPALLATAVEPFTLEHTATLADVAPEELVRLRDAVRAAGRVAIETGTGTGVTMTADKANVTQWLAWVLMILTGSMNRPGGIWFHPGFAYQLEGFELPISPPEGSFGPGPRSRPGTQSFMAEWPCATLVDEIEAGNIRAVLNLGGSLMTSFRHHRDHRQRNRCAVDSRAADQGPTRTVGRHDLGRAELASLGSTHACGRRTGRRPALDVVVPRRARPTARARRRQPHAVRRHDARQRNRHCTLLIQ